MSKITFRADDELITRIEAMDASKSEVMREGIRLIQERETRLAVLDQALEDTRQEMAEGQQWGQQL